MDIKLKKEDYFNQENIKVSIELDNYILKPEGYIEGNIILTPKLKSDFKLSNTKIILTLIQYEFFEHLNKESKENNNKTLKSNEQHKEIIFNKESKIELENDRISSKVKVPIKISIPKNDKLLPSFNLKTKDFLSGIRHIFTVKIPGINAIDSLGVFFCDKEKYIEENKKDEFNTIFKDEQINTMGLINKGKISYCIRTAKNFYKNNENIDIKVMVDSSELHDYKINQIIIKLQRKITIFGYTVNSDIRYTLYTKSFESNELMQKNSNKFELEWTIPKLDENTLNEKDIEQYIHFSEKNNNELENKFFSPTFKGYFFSCEYKIKIRNSTSIYYFYAK